MFMFCGDSHSRQFQMDVSGALSFTSFSGATLKGLGAPGGKLNHHQIVMDLARVKTRKTLLVMFGGVDLDASYFRKIVEEGGVDDAVFFRDRAVALEQFVTQCRQASGKYVQRLCFLLPQASALVDEHFIESTAKMAKVDAGALAAAGQGQDWSLLSRCRRARAFNDYLAGAVDLQGMGELYRIDEAMVDPAGMLKPEFLPRNPRDHHPNPLATLPIWQERLQDVMPAFRKFHLRREAKNAARLAAAAG